MFADNERVLADYQKEIKGKIEKFDFYEKNNKKLNKISKNMMAGLKSYTDKGLKKKFFAAILQDAEENKLGAHEV